MNRIYDVGSDPVSLVLLGALVLLTVPTVVLTVAWRATRLPFRAGSLRWVYLAWALLLAAASVWNLSRDVRFSADEAGSDNYVRLAFLALGILVILFVGAKHRFAFLSELTGGVLALFFFFALWGTASTFWSVSPAGTAYKSLEYCTMLALLALAASLINSTVRGRRNRMLALKSVFDFNWFLTFLLLISVYAGLLIFPEYAIVRNTGILGTSIQGALPGIAANGVGQIGAILGAVSLARILYKPESRHVFVPLLIVSLLTMVLAQSRSPILGFLLAVFLILVASRRFGVLLLVSGSVVGVILSPGYGQTIYDFLGRGQDEGNLRTLSGRTEYWDISLQAVRESWINGLGANVGGRHVLQDVMGESTVSTVHNAYVEVLLDTGAVGLALLVAGLIAAWVSLFWLRSRVMKDPVGRLLWIECLGLFAVLTVRSLFAVPFVWSSNVLTFGLILVFLHVARRQFANDKRRYADTTLAQPIPAARRRRSGVRG